MEFTVQAVKHSRSTDTEGYLQAYAAIKKQVYPGVCVRPTAHNRANQQSQDCAKGFHTNSTEGIDVRRAKLASGQLMLCQGKRGQILDLTVSIPVLTLHSKLRLQ